MTFAVYVDGEGYIGDVSGGDREDVAKFVMSMGYEAGTFELREVSEDGSLV